MILPAIGLALFCGAILLAVLCVQAVARDRRQVARTLGSIRTIDAPHRASAEPGAGSAARIALLALRRAGEVARRLARDGSAERARRLLSYAGSPAGWDAERLLAAKFALAAVLAPVAFVSASGAARLAFGAVGAAGGYYAPEILIRSRARRRQEAISRALPDALDLLAVIVEAGLGFDSALVRVAQQATGPLAEELNRVLREMQLGRSRADALRHLAERSDLPELRSFVLALVQADAFGVSIARVLQVQAAEMRTKRRQKAEERAQKIPVKIVFPLVLCILPALFVVLLGPAAINVYRSLVASP